MDGLLWQQLVRLPQSAAVGAALGILLDWSGGYWRGKSYRRALFVSDILLFATAALVTLFAALVIADGQLHPAIFVGLLLGALGEHIVVGRWLSALAYRVHTVLRVCAVGIRRLLQHFNDVVGIYRREEWIDRSKSEKN